MTVSVFLLIAVILTSTGDPDVTYLPFDSMSDCQSAEAVQVNETIASGITQGSFSCVEFKIGELT